MCEQPQPFVTSERAPVHDPAWARYFHEAEGFGANPESRFRPRGWNCRRGQRGLAVETRGVRTSQVAKWGSIPYWFMRTMSETERYSVPLIDPETGDGWDEEVDAESPKEAIQIATSGIDENVHVASSFIREHMEVDA